MKEKGNLVSKKGFSLSLIQFMVDCTVLGRLNNGIPRGETFRLTFDYAFSSFGRPRKASAWEITRNDLTNDNNGPIKNRCQEFRFYGSVLVDEKKKFPA